MKELLSLLHNIHPLSPELYSYLAGHLQTEQVKARQHLLQAGQVCRRMWFLKKGLLRCYHLVGEQQVCSKFMKEGDIIVAAPSFFLQLPGDECIETIEDSTVASICFSELQYIYQHFPEFNTIARVLTTKSYLLSEQRAAVLRLPNATLRYSYMLEKQPELVLRVPAKYMASYLGIAKETISRIRGKIPKR